MGIRHDRGIWDWLSVTLELRPSMDWFVIKYWVTPKKAVLYFLCPFFHFNGSLKLISFARVLVRDHEPRSVHLHRCYNNKTGIKRCKFSALRRIGVDTFSFRSSKEKRKTRDKTKTYKSMFCHRNRLLVERKFSLETQVSTNFIMFNEIQELEGDWKRWMWRVEENKWRWSRTRVESKVCRTFDIWVVEVNCSSWHWIRTLYIPFNMLRLYCEVKNGLFFTVFYRLSSMPSVLYVWSSKHQSLTHV
jgi:hypothetical protein